MKSVFSNTNVLIYFKKNVYINNVKNINMLCYEKMERKCIKRV